MNRESAHKERDSMMITRPIKIKRDLDGAKGVVKRLRAAPKRDSAAEERLQALLAEMDRYEQSASEDGEGDDDFSHTSLDGGARRRWSDDGRDD